MDITIHQPNFFPRLKILQKIASSDIWVIMDRVQYVHQEWQNRTKIVPYNGDRKEFWISLPVFLPYGVQTVIKDVVQSPINYRNPKFVNRMKRALESTFSKSLYWHELKIVLEDIYPYLEMSNLSDINIGITKSLLSLTGRLPRIIYASGLPIRGKASQLVANICHYLDADRYLCDSGGKRYLDTSLFNKESQIVWQKWEEPEEKADGISSWRNISCLNYIAREGTLKFVQHLNSGDFKIESDFY